MVSYLCTASRSCLKRYWGVLHLCVLAVCGLHAPSAAADKLYHERLRPRFHFTSAHGYINDPNGLIFVDDTYHLFFQTGSINSKRWGHAVSTDLLHWKQTKDALLPQNGHPAFSGCAVIDEDNTSGFQTGVSPPIVAVFTSWGEGQCLAYSNDQGVTWRRYANNPVLRLPHDAKRSFLLSARDPHVMWYENHQRWVMVLYENLHDEKIKGAARDQQGGFSFFTSPDLKQWTRRSHLPGFYVCPDVFQLSIEGEDRKAWVAMDWAQYTTGDFTGTEFKPAAPPAPLDFGGINTLSANQTWKHLPDGRTIQICWIRGGKYEEMPFDQQHSFPASLSLRRMGDRLRLCKQPIKEIVSLYGEVQRLSDIELSAGDYHQINFPSHSYDLEMELSIPKDSLLVFDVLGQPIMLGYDRVYIQNREVCLEMPLSQLRILADVSSIEVFANHGLATMTFTVAPPAVPQPVRLSAVRGMISLPSVALRKVRTIWPE